MSFKNALKNLVANFGCVWSLLLYIVLFAALITGVSLPFIMPIGDALSEAGVFSHIGGAFSTLFGDGGWQGMWNELYAAYEGMTGVFSGDGRMVSLTVYFFVFIILIAFRFFLGLYEIPLATVLDGRLSCNAHYGLGGKFFSTLWTAVRYSFAKMLYTLGFDALASLIVYGIGSAVGMTVVLPFLVIFVLALLWAFRFSLVACWAPCVACGECNVAKGFLRSAKIFFKRFGSIYSTYLISLLLILALGAFFTLFTLGIGLIVILPLCATYICYLNATEFYTKTGRRFYVDGDVFTPPADNVL